MISSLVAQKQQAGLKKDIAYFKKMQKTYKEVDEAVAAGALTDLAGYNSSQLEVRPRKYDRVQPTNEVPDEMKLRAAVARSNATAKTKEKGRKLLNKLIKL